MSLTITRARSDWSRFAANADGHHRHSSQSAAEEDPLAYLRIPEDGRHTDAADERDGPRHKNPPTEAPVRTLALRIYQHDRAADPTQLGSVGSVDHAKDGRTNEGVRWQAINARQSR